MLRAIGQCVSAMVLCAGMAGVASAQRDETGTVIGQGTVILRPKPTHLRMQVQLQGQGKSVQQALERLKTRREAAVAKLKDLNAEADSIACGSPSISKGLSWPSYSTPGTAIPAPAIPTPPRASYVPSTNAEPAPGLSSPGLSPVPMYGPAPGLSTPPVAVPSSPWMPATPPAVPIPATPPTEMPTTQPPTAAVREGNPMPPTPPTVVAPSTSPPAFATASMTLTAQWRLEGETLEQILIAAESLQEKIANTDLGGDRVATPLPPPTEEGNTGGGYPGAPLNMPVPFYAPATQSGTSAAGPFVYVARPSGPERKKALAEAFEQAKRQAAEWAEATGKRLGEIDLLDGDTIVGQDVVPAPDPRVGGGSDVVAPSPDALAFTVRVRVSFHLLPGPH